MPIIQSAKKAMKQSRVKRTRNFRTRDDLKLAIKEVITEVKNGSKPAAEKALQAAYKIIDTASKKNLIHKNNAANKKSKLAKMIANIEKKKEDSPKANKKAAPKKAAAKKEEPKEEAKAEEKAE